MPRGAQLAKLAVTGYWIEVATEFDSLNMVAELPLTSTA